MTLHGMLSSGGGGFYMQEEQSGATTWLIIITAVCIGIIIIQYAVYILRLAKENRAKTTGLKRYNLQSRYSSQQPQQPYVETRPGGGLETYSQYQERYGGQQVAQYPSTSAYYPQPSGYLQQDIDPYRYDPYRTDPMRYDPLISDYPGGAESDLPDGAGGLAPTPCRSDEFIKCSNCGAEIGIVTTICPYCHVELREKRRAF